MKIYQLNYKHTVFTNILLLLILLFFRLKADDAASISPEPKSEESENNDNKSSTKLHCRALVLLFSKCFTMSLFSALHKDLFVHNSDVQAAMDQCIETAYEIDITEYIKVYSYLFI